MANRFFLSQISSAIFRKLKFIVSIRPSLFNCLLKNRKNLFFSRSEELLSSYTFILPLGYTNWNVARIAYFCNHWVYCHVLHAYMNFFLLYYYYYYLLAGSTDWVMSYKNNKTEKLSTFDGTRDNWPNFWNIYDFA